MSIAFIALIISLYKEECVGKTEDKKLYLKVNDKYLEKIFKDIIIDDENSLKRIGELSFNRKVEVFEKIRNKIAHGDFELDEETITIKEPDGRFFESPDLGTAGDIYVMPQSRIEYFPMLSSFISYLFGGHAGVITENQMLVEAMGGTSEEGYVYWYNTDLLREERTVIGLRVDAPIEDRKQASSNAMSLVGKKYNYWFIFNTKSITSSCIF